MYNEMPKLSTKQEEWERGYCAQVLRGDIMWGLENTGVSTSDQKDTRYVNVDSLEHDKRRIPTVVKHLKAQGYFSVSADDYDYDKIVTVAQKWEAAPKFSLKGGEARKSINDLYEPLNSFNNAEIIYLYYHQDAFDIKYMEVTRSRTYGRSRYMQGSGYVEKYQDWRVYPKESLGAADMLLYEGQIEAWVVKNLPRAIKELSGQTIGGGDISSLEPRDLDPKDLSWSVSHHIEHAKIHLARAQDYLKIRKYVRGVVREIQDKDKVYPVILTRMSALIKKRAAFYAMDKKDDRLSRLAKTALQSGWVG
jgi:hypothetical protein